MIEYDEYFDESGALNLKKRHLEEIIRALHARSQREDIEKEKTKMLNELIEIFSIALSQVEV